MRVNEKGVIPDNIPPIFKKLGIDFDEWLKIMSFNNRFYRAIGRLQAMKECAIKTEQK